MIDVQDTTEELRIEILNGLGLSLASKRQEAMAARAAGVYTITNTVTGKLYIGSSVNMANRETEHRRALRKSTHHSQKLQRSWDKHGEAAFSFAPLLICAQKNLLMYEQIVLDALSPARYGYNVLPTAGSRMGMRHSAETRAKMSKSSIGKVMSPEAVEKMRIATRGRKHSADARAKISIASKGRELPPAFIAQMKNRDRPMAMREKISNTLMGHVVTQETRAKMSAAHTGIPHPPITEETRQRMRIAAQARCIKQAERKAAGA